MHDAIDAPEYCDICCSVNIVFNGSNWFCPDCGASVSVHVGTNLPVGRMADRQTRRLRATAHLEFDKLWLERYMSRDRAYSWLANQLGVVQSMCHISRLNRDQLRDVITLSSTYIQNNLLSLEKRKEKRYVKYKQLRRENVKRFKPRRSGRSESDI